MSDPMKPTVSLLVKIGSIAVHADEYTSPDASDFDGGAIRQLVEDHEVKSWIDEMSAQGLLPSKRQ